MSAISAISVQPSFIPKGVSPPPSPSTKPVDSDGDHDNSPPAGSSTGRRVNVTA